MQNNSENNNLENNTGQPVQPEKDPSLMTIKEKQAFFKAQQDKLSNNSQQKPQRQPSKLNSKAAISEKKPESQLDNINSQKSNIDVVSDTPMTMEERRRAYGEKPKQDYSRNKTENTKTSKKDKVIKYAPVFRVQEQEVEADWGSSEEVSQQDKTNIDLGSLGRSMFNIFTKKSEPISQARIEVENIALNARNQTGKSDVKSNLESLFNKRKSATKEVQNENAESTGENKLLMEDAKNTLGNFLGNRKPPKMVLESINRSLAENTTGNVIGSTTENITEPTEIISTAQAKNALGNFFGGGRKAPHPMVLKSLGENTIEPVEPEQQQTRPVMNPFLLSGIQGGLGGLGAKKKVKEADTNLQSKIGAPKVGMSMNPEILSNKLTGLKSTKNNDIINNKSQEKPLTEAQIAQQQIAARRSLYAGNQVVNDDSDSDMSDIDAPAKPNVVHKKTPTELLSDSIEARISEAEKSGSISNKEKKDIMVDVISKSTLQQNEKDAAMLEVEKRFSSATKFMNGIMTISIKTQSLAKKARERLVMKKIASDINNRIDMEEEIESRELSLKEKSDIANDIINNAALSKNLKENLINASKDTYGNITDFVEKESPLDRERTSIAIKNEVFSQLLDAIDSQDLDLFKEIIKVYDNVLDFNKEESSIFEKIISVYQDDENLAKEMTEILLGKGIKILSENDREDIPEDINNILDKHKRNPITLIAKYNDSVEQCKLSIKNYVSNNNPGQTIESFLNDGTAIKSKIITNAEKIFKAGNPFLKEAAQDFIGNAASERTVNTISNVENEQSEHKYPSQVENLQATKSQSGGIRGFFGF